MCIVGRVGFLSCKGGTAFNSYSLSPYSLVPSDVAVVFSRLCARLAARLRITSEVAPSSWIRGRQATLCSLCTWILNPLHPTPP